MGYNPKQKAEKPSVAPRQGARADWMRSNATFIAGQSCVDEVDLLAGQMERYWGVDRLRLLVSPELRERFDKRRYALNHAIWEGDLEDVRRECALMMKAWQGCDKAARAAGHRKIEAEAWEIALDDGTVLVLCRRMNEMQFVKADGRKKAVWSLEEVANMISRKEEWATAVKVQFPGARVVVQRATVGDPLAGLDASGELDDPVPF